MEDLKNENIFTALPQAFIKELELVVEKVMIEAGVKKNAEILDTIEFTTEGSRDSLYMLVKDTYRYINDGRKPKAKKIPVYKLIQFIKKNNINPTGKQTVNQLAFIMQRSIYKAGIKGKHFIEKVESAVGDVVEIKVADFLEEYLADQLVASFKIN